MNRLGVWIIGVWVLLYIFVTNNKLSDVVVCFFSSVGVWCSCHVTTTHTH